MRGIRHSVAAVVAFGGATSVFCSLLRTRAVEQTNRKRSAQHFTHKHRHLHPDMRYLEKEEGIKQEKKGCTVMRDTKREKIPSGMVWSTAVTHYKYQNKQTIITYAFFYLTKK